MRLVALVLLAGLALAGCGDDDPAAGSTDPVSGRPDSVGGDTSSVLVPTGTVELEVGEPQDEVAPDAASDGTTHRAPDGTTYVGVDWQYLPRHGLPTFAAAVMDDDTQTVRLRLVADGRTYDLGTTPAASGDVFVPVEGSGEDVRVEVEFDGETQSVDGRTGERDPGAFAPLYELGDGTPAGCAGVRSTRGTTTATCAAQLVTVPWLPERGWSADGWTAVEVSTSTTGFRVGGSDYQVGELSDASTVDGEPPVSTVTVSSAARETITRLVAPAPVERVEVRRQGAAALLSGTGPERVDYTLVATITP